ncbi:hypothetical protein VTK26DRAFT_1483 [Humicola hyalothermophila]
MAFLVLWNFRSFSGTRLQILQWTKQDVPWAKTRLCLWFLWRWTRSRLELGLYPLQRDLFNSYERNKCCCRLTREKTWRCGQDWGGNEHNYIALTTHLSQGSMTWKCRSKVRTSDREQAGSHTALAKRSTRHLDVHIRLCIVVASPGCANDPPRLPRYST